MGKLVKPKRVPDPKAALATEGKMAKWVVSLLPPDTSGLYGEPGLGSVDRTPRARYEILNDIGSNQLVAQPARPHRRDHAPAQQQHAIRIRLGVHGRRRTLPVVTLLARS